MFAIQNFRRIIFQGDSITDAGRIRVGNNLGVGYVFIVTSWIKRYYPQIKIEIINKGVSGDTVLDLKKRWQQDCIDLQPDLVTILIGINDCVNKISDKQYEDVYTELLLQVREKTSASIILMEPFLLETKPEHKELKISVYNKCAIVKKLAEKFN
ncbi:MAG: GDSL-type esterase/lipase family protein, partial [Endomicrobia bacterium]|nr:GDSL-type esterase/lipase family protein [Endomicrobiia bacterium]